MTYHRTFDRLGKSVCRAKRTPTMHRIVQRLALLACVACIVLLVPGVI